MNLLEQAISVPYTNFNSEIGRRLKINVGFRELVWPTLIGLFSVRRYVQFNLLCK